MTYDRTIIIGGNLIAIAELFFSNRNFSTSNFVAGQKENNSNKKHMITITTNKNNNNNNNTLKKRQ